MSNLSPEDSKALELFGAEVRKHVDGQFQKSQADLLDLIEDLQNRVRTLEVQVRGLALGAQSDEQ